MRKTPFKKKKQKNPLPVGFIRVGFLIAHPALSKVSDGSVRRSAQEFNSGVTAQRETYFKSIFIVNYIFQV